MERIGKLERAGRMIKRVAGSKWFYIILLIAFFMPAYSQKPYDPAETTSLIKEVLSNPLIYHYPVLFPVSKLLPAALIILVLLFKNRTRTYLNIYAFLFYMLTAFFQHSAVTGTYGLVILAGNVIVVFVTALSWLWEVFYKTNDFSKLNESKLNWLIVLLAAFAYWYPVNTVSITPDFGLGLLFGNEAGLTYCMMTPVILALMVIYFPHINLITMRVTSFVGIIFGLMNMITWFVISPEMWWMGVVHVPLITISIYAFSLSLPLRGRHNQVIKQE